MRDERTTSRNTNHASRITLYVSKAEIPGRNSRHPRSDVARVRLRRRFVCGDGAFRPAATIRTLPKRSRCAFARARSRRERSENQRSEEHTSELQSLAYLVCRLLLEKKNKHN